MGFDIESFLDSTLDAVGGLVSTSILYPLHIQDEVVRIPRHKTILIFLGDVDGSDKTIESGSMSDSQARCPTESRPKKRCRDT